MPRVTSAKDIFDNMPSVFVPEAAKGMNAVVQFELTGAGGGDWNATIKDGTLAVAQGRAASPTVTLTASAADYLAIVNGDLSAMKAYMGGRVKVKGDLNLVMKMQKLFRPPTD